ncbi:MAG: TonB-dependent receptor, partial [Gammaproteobacteria bacterium]|nr:TonB-dependent receptor [Gammaproteobacteria bacterium]
GNSVTVRGFGADFNLVTFNGRQMPTASLGDGASPPSSRSYDFANLASESIAGVEVYKTSNPTVASGGIGSTINIKSARPLEAPGLKWTVGGKGVMDTSQNDSTDTTPEISGFYSNTFADDTFGIAVSGSYQQRKASVNQANVGWRDGYLGDCDFAGEWGALPRAECNSWNQTGLHQNQPGDGDVYAIPQNADYALADIDRERVNGQVVLQYRPSDRLTGTLDYTYSENEIEVRNSSVGIWFNHEFTASAWTDGPVAGPLFYTEIFDFMPWQGGVTDLSYSGSLTSNISENASLGLNLEWEATDNLTLELDYHDSSAESKPNNIYGSNMSVGTTVISLREQSIDFSNDLPLISYIDNGINPEDPANRLASGSAFRNAQFRDDLDQLQLNGRYEVDQDIFAAGAFVDSIDFGVSLINNNVQSTYGFLQTDSWGGLGTPADIPDEIFTFESLPDKFDGIPGANDPGMLQGFYSFNFEQMVDTLEQQFGICSNSWTGTNIEGTCLANPTVDRRIKEETVAAYVQFNNTFDMLGRDANLNIGGRYEETEVTSSALVPIPVGTNWAADNEFFLTFNDPIDLDFTTLNDKYHHFLPSVSFDMMPTEYTKLRAAWSTSITRPTYANLQGGTELATLFRIGGGFGSEGNPGLPPNESKNFDISYEWYYNDDSYISLGYFNKRVDNFVGTDVIKREAFGLTNPAFGPNADFCRAQVGQDSSAIRQCLIDNFDTIGDPADDPVIFDVTIPVTNDETATLEGYEFAFQHNFGDSGFGAIFNYTIVDGDFAYDNTKSYRDSQFTLVGLSDSANLIAFYDKDGIQARLAYNWRDEFLAGNGPNPFYTEAYGQLDANLSYELNDNWIIFAESINLTGEDRRGHRRSDNTVTFSNPGEPRYMIGARYKY